MLGVLVAFGLSPGCQDGDGGDGPDEEVDSAEQALVHACWPPGTPAESAQCAGGFSYTLACPDEPDEEALGCGSDTQYTPPQQTLAQAQAHAAAAWAALGGLGQPEYRVPPVCTSCTDTSAADVNGCWPAGTADAQKTCAGGFNYAIECHAKYPSPACPIAGYQQTTCTEYNTCTHPDFGVASRGTRQVSTTLSGGYDKIRQCYTDPETHQQFCDWVYVPKLSKTCVQTANEQKAALPAADAALVTFTTNQGPTSGDGETECWASCNITFSNWPTYNSGTGWQCGVKSTYSCNDLSQPIFAECRHASHGLIPASACGPELRQSAAGSSLAQVKSEAQSAWAAIGGAGTVPFSMAPLCTSCTDVVPTTPQNGQTPGATEGAVSVTSDGAANYTVPLWVPDGRAGLAPDLSLAYSNRGGNGLLGVGFRLSGLSRIMRCAKTLAQDGEAKDVQMDVTDRFCLDGQQLVAVNGGVYGAYGTEYRTEDNTFTKVVSLQSDGYGPTTFRAYRKDGRILTFGGTVDTRVEGRRLLAARDAAGAGTVESIDSPTARYAWLLGREEDRSGNFSQYSYGVNAGNDWQRDSERWPTEIAYVGHGPSGRAPTRFVRFFYENRPDVDEAYVSGLKIVTSRRMSRVEVWGPSPTQQALLRTYRFAYTNTSITGNSRLAEVQECDGTGVCKRPTKLEWSQGSWDFTRKQLGEIDWQDPLAGKSYATEIHYAADVNGDGRDDILSRAVDHVGATNVWRLYTDAAGPYNYGPGFYGPLPAQPTGELWDPPVRFSDIDADGRADFFNIGTPPGGGARRWMRWESGAPNSEGFAWDGTDGETPTMWTAGSLPAEPLLYFADLDGDGLPEALRLQKQGAGYIWSFRPNNGGVLGDYIPLGNIGGLLDAQPYTARIDGSGRTSLLIPETQTSAAGVRFLTALRLGSMGMEQVPTTLAASTPSSGERRHWIADVNGDGLDDALRVPLSGGTPHIAINSGRGFRAPIQPGLTPSYQIASFLPFMTALGRAGVFTGDLDLDGKQDLIVGQNHTPELQVRTSWVVLRLRGNTWVPQDLPVPLGELTPRGPAHAMLLDSNGDGLTDIAQAERDPAGKRVLVVYTRQGPLPDLLQGVVDGAGARSELSYALQGGDRPYPAAPSRPYAWQTTIALPQTSLRHPVSVVTELRLDNGVGTLNRYTHSYGDGRRDLTRGWLGFGVHRVTDVQTGATTYTEYDVSSRVGNAYPSAGQPVYERSQVTLDSGWTHLTETATRYATIQEQNGKVRFAYPQRVLTVTVDVPPGQLPPSGRSWLPDAPNKANVAGAVITSGAEVVRTSDADGNVTSESLKRLYGGQLTGEELLTTTTYAPRDAAGWLIGLPETKTTTHTTALGASATRVVAFEHDPATGLLTADVVEPNNAALRLRTEIQRNGFGMPSRIEASDAAGHHRATAIEYDSTEEAYPAVVTNALGHQTRAAHHPGLGVPVAATLPNGATTRYQYDGFGRLRAIDSPDGGDVTQSYLWAADGVVERHVQEADGSSTVARFDKLGREVERRTNGFDGQPVLTRRVFDALGRLSAGSMPRTAAEQERLTTYAYDKLGRVLSETRPDTTTAQRKYFSDRTEMIDPKGHVSYVLYDTAGRVTESADDPYATAALKTSFVYGPFDLPKQVRVLENGQARVTTAMAYDGLGRRTLLDELHGPGATAGYHEETEYDAFGQVIRRVDARAQETTFKYDVLGRPAHRVAPEGTTLYTWDDAPGASVGQLASTTSADGVAVSYTYDGLGRLGDSTTTVDGHVYTVSRQYDAVGRLLELAYPSVPGQARFRARYLYNAGGHLTGVKNPDSNLQYWTATSVDARGQVRAESFGNGVTSFHGFDPVRFVPLNTETFDANDSLVQDLWFDFDANGNFVKRDDYIYQVHEAYAYDDHDRLATWTVNAYGPVQTQYTYQYDGLGRLTWRYLTQGSGDETEVFYDTTGTVNPYAPIGSEAGSYGYDPNGNQVSRPGRTMQFTSFNLPRQVDRAGGASTSYRYGSDQARAVKETSGGEKTTYIEDLYERRANVGHTQHVFHVRAAGRVVAQATWNAQGSTVTKTVSYLHTDHLGSPDVITDGAGAASYQRHDPFGRRANPANPVEPVAAAGTSVRLGFTGHEMDDEDELVNMRGRVYDPYTGHFLSRDPVVQAPFNPRAHNRYAYVGYNPLSVTDPTGFTGDPVIWISSPFPWGSDGGVVVAPGSGYSGGDGGDGGGGNNNNQIERRNSDDSLNPSVLEPPPAPRVQAATAQSSSGTGDQRSTWQKTKDGYYFGTGFGEESALYYANIIDNPNSTDLEVASAWLGGSMATLWTPDTYLDTASTLVPAGKIGAFFKGVGRGLMAGAAKLCASGVCNLIKNACFIAGTPVLTPEGLRPIESLQPGDIVVSRDPEATAGPWQAPAAAPQERGRSDDADRPFDGEGRAPSLDDVVGVLASGGKPASRGALRDAHVGARVAFQGRVYETRQRGERLELRESGETLQRVQKVMRRSAEELVELTVRTSLGEHLQVGTAEHPFYVPALQAFVPMGQLEPGMGLLGEGGQPAEVVAVATRAVSSEVFNFEVEGTHTYFICEAATASCELVHNECWINGIRVVSRIKESKGLIKAAESLHDAAQREVNDLLTSYLFGNKSPGIGTKVYRDGIFYLRGSEGGRIFLRRLEDGYEILAKADKQHEEQVFRLLDQFF